MKTFDVPEWIIVPMQIEGVDESKGFLYGAGRALGFVKMARSELAILNVEHLKEAEYHAYCGISATRTAIDATACWLNSLLQIGQPNNSGLDICKSAFRAKVLDHSCNSDGSLLEPINSLAELGNEIDDHRQKAQHREGALIEYHAESRSLNHPEGWYLLTGEQNQAKQNSTLLVGLLDKWVYVIEKNLFLAHHRLHCTSLDENHLKKLLGTKGTYERIGAWNVPTTTDCPFHS